ncbi:hypothetical protein M0R45_009594 [Rubus argutus]|uniref:Protein DA1-like domain-containing protein n=1 Tax=Rubus argutus TaxID=59490 RepID=A0AAW1Y713_RUBAR
MSHNILDNCDVFCSDIEARESGDVNLGDGRQLCSDCSSISVKNEEEYNFIIENVFQFYRSLNLKVDENILILFIDNNQMHTVTAMWKWEGILAHEIMHAWFNLQGIPWKSESSVEEGMCEVMSYKWLQWFSSTGFDSSHKTNKQVQYTLELKEFLAEVIECQRDEVYGQGFKNAMRAVETFGFKTTLDHIVKNGTLPVVPPPVPYSTTTITPTKLVRKKTTSTPITKLLWKATSNTGTSLWNAIAALLWKTTATCETPRFIIMEGHRHHHYHQGQSHTILQGGLSTSPALLVFIGILIEHK